MDPLLIERIKRRIAVGRYKVANVHLAGDDTGYSYNPDKAVLDPRTEARIPMAVAYADEVGYATDHDAYCLVMSRLCYTDEGIAQGARYNAIYRTDW